MKRLLTIFLLVSLLLPQVSVAGNFVQGAICTLSATASSTMTCALPGTATPGNIIVAAVGYTIGTVTVIAFTDDQSGSYTLTNSLYGLPAATEGGAIGTGTVGNAATPTVTATYTNSVQPTYHIMCVLEYSGVNTVTRVDQTHAGNSASPGTATDAVTSGAATTTADGETIVGTLFEIQNVTDTVVAGTNYTSRTLKNTGTDLRGVCEDLTQSTAGSIAATGTATGGTGDTIAFLVALKNVTVQGLQNATGIFGTVLK